MPISLSYNDPDFEKQFCALLSQKREEAEEVDQSVLAIINDVRSRGDEAVIELTQRFDNLKLSPQEIAFSPDEIKTHIARVNSDDRAALTHAAKRIRAYHEKQRPQDNIWDDEDGATLGWRWSAVSAAGLYVPGGLASYPSSVLMNAIPAQVAGVERLAICCPTPKGEVNPLVLLAAQLSGVSTIYRIGGAQAIAALAYGTKSIKPVDKITGPGNAYVAAAKRRVFGKVGIDMIAGPSEVLIIADDNNDPDWVAIDLLSQAEHDESAQSVLITNSADFAHQVKERVNTFLKTLKRREIAQKSWEQNGAIIIVETLEQASELANRIAPEHLELMVENPDKLALQIHHAGAIFLGAWTPEAIGDYAAGPNHVLPTARSARFSSGLSVLDFMKRTTISKMSPNALASIGPSAEQLATCEGLEAHALSLRLRLNKLNKK